MNIVEKKISYTFSSDPARGAYAITDKGSSFSVNLNYPIALPKTTKYATIEVHSASIWYVSPNISAALGNNIFSYWDGTKTLTFTIADGLYNFPQLVAAISLTADSQPSPPVIPFLQQFRFYADDPTQRTAIQFLVASGPYINWVVGGMWDVFGFTLGSTTGPTAINTVIFSDTQAQFNILNQYLIQSDLVHTGIPVNSNQTNVLTTVYIDVPPGSQLNFQPQQPQLCNADELIGGTRTNFRFFLTDQNNRPIDTFGEFWSFIVTIRYFIPV